MRAVHVPGAGGQPNRLLFGEVLEELDAAAVEAAIAKRLALVQQCVGDLYPRILLAEVQALRARRMP
jgi:phage baseplate assembly protein W